MYEKHKASLMPSPGWVAILMGLAGILLALLGAALSR